MRMSQCNQYHGSAELGVWKARAMRLGIGLGGYL